MTKRIAVIAAHPDDEALGCGGTLLKCKALNYEIHLMFMTDGLSARTNTDDKQKSEREKGFKAALDFLKPTSYVHLSYPDNQLDTVPVLEVTQNIESFLKSVQPHVVLTHYWNDLNIDHCITHRATLTACRPGSQYAPQKILSFEVPSSTEWSLEKESFKPNYYMDITACLEEKLKYLKCYDSEMRPFPHPRSYENIRALHQHRGATVSVAYAEAFHLVRRIADDI